LKNKNEKTRWLIKHKKGIVFEITVPIDWRRCRNLISELAFGQSNESKSRIRFFLSKIISCRVLFSCFENMFELKLTL